MALDQDIENALSARANGANIDDLSKIASAYKSVSDVRIADFTIKSKSRDIRMEAFKSAAAFLVPIVSLLALFGTIISQSNRISESRQQLENSEWRDLLSSLKGPLDSVYADPTVAPRLRSFFDSASYGSQAKSIAGRLMGHLSNSDSFDDLFSSVFGSVNKENMKEIADIGRSLTSTRSSIFVKCNDILYDQSIDNDTKLLDCGIYAHDERELAQTLIDKKVPPEFIKYRLQEIQIDR